jgi:hypothetical protein
MSLSGSDMGALLASERRGFAQALHEIRKLLRGARAVELYGAAGSLGAAMAAGLRSGAGGAATLLYVVADEETAEARAHDIGFFLPPPPASDDPLLPPSVLELPAPDSSPYAEMQPDRRTMLRRMAALSGCRTGSRRACWSPRRRRFSGGSCRARLSMRSAR